MTADTTFREFVEETGMTFCLLEFGSPRYRDLVEEFNRAKLELEAKAEDREREEWRVRLGLSSTPKQCVESTTPPDQNDSDVTGKPRRREGRPVASLPRGRGRNAISFVR